MALMAEGFAMLTYTCVAGFSKLVNLEQESFMDAIKRVQHLPSTICEHPHLRDATQLDLSGAKMVALPEGELCSPNASH